MVRRIINREVEKVKEGKKKVCALKNVFDLCDFAVKTLKFMMLG